jgi:hypothetical protein
MGIGTGFATQAEQQEAGDAQVAAAFELDPGAPLGDVAQGQSVG